MSITFFCQPHRAGLSPLSTSTPFFISKIFYCLPLSSFPPSARLSSLIISPPFYKVFLLTAIQFLSFISRVFSSLHLYSFLHQQNFYCIPLSSFRSSASHSSLFISTPFFKNFLMSATQLLSFIRKLSPFFTSTPFFISKFSTFIFSVHFLRQQGFISTPFFISQIVYCLPLSSFP